MKGRFILAVIAANLLALGALIAIWPNFMISPGKLTPAHASLSTDCFACHAPFRGASADRCVSCHAVATIGLFTTRGAKLPAGGRKAAFHRQLVKLDCLSCHTLHAGSALTLGHRQTFSHDLLPTASRAKCETCHAPPRTTIHQGVTANCGQCHGLRAWKPAIFDHGKFFLLEGPHAAACATCHVNSDTRHYTCFGCHAHQPDSLRARHAREGIRNIENCVQCHRSAHGEPGEGGSEGGSEGRKGDD